jgi:hypothetical protein
MKLGMILVATRILVGCPEPQPPRPTPNDGGVVTCEDYCRHIRDELHCAQGQPTKKGATCEQVCGNIENSGYVQNARTCSMAARSCEAVDICEN